MPFALQLRGHNYSYSASLPVIHRRLSQDAEHYANAYEILLPIQ